MLRDDLLRAAAFAVFAALVGVTLAACSKRAEPPPRRSAPWPAQSSASIERRDALRFSIEPSGRARFVLEAPKRKLRGRVRLSRGELELDPADLRRLRGRIAMDLGSLVIEGDDDEPDRDESARAQAWLGLGSSRPEAERERLRWAEFRILRALDVGASDVRQGRRLSPGELTRLAEHGVEPAATEGARPAADSGAEPAADLAARDEARRVDLTLEGTLELLGYRVERRVEVALAMEWPDRDENVAPTRVALATTRPLSVYLTEHQIVPRDALGNLVSSELHRMGQDVGREAKVSASFVALRAQ